MIKGFSVFHSWKACENEDSHLPASDFWYALKLACRSRRRRGKYLRTFERKKNSRFLLRKRSSQVTLWIGIYLGDESLNSTGMQSRSSLGYWLRVFPWKIQATQFFTCIFARKLYEFKYFNCFALHLLDFRFAVFHWGGFLLFHLINGFDSCAITVVVILVVVVLLSNNIINFCYKWYLKSVRTLKP